MKESHTIEEGFKLVCRVDGNFASYCYGHSSMVQYVPGEWAEPLSPHGPLAVFVSKKCLLSFWGLRNEHAHIPEHYAAFKCEFVRSSYFQLWTTRVMGRAEILPVDKCPFGTILADKVRITQEVPFT